MTPYDPLPGITSSNQSARNSNSFASTLLDVARSKGRGRSMPTLSGFTVEQYPGWHLNVSTLKPSPSTKPERYPEKDNSTDVDSPEAQISESRQILTRKQLRRIIREVQQISLNPYASSDFDYYEGTPKPVVQGRVCGVKDKNQASSKFMKEKGIEPGGYFITCEPASGGTESGLAGAEGDMDGSPYPRQYHLPKPGKRCWVCVANKDEGAAEQGLTFPEEDPPPGAESI